MHDPKARKELQILGKHLNLMSMCFWMFLIMYFTDIHIFSNVEPLFGGPPPLLPSIISIWALHHHSWHNNLIHDAQYLNSHPNVANGSKKYHWQPASHGWFQYFAGFPQGCCDPLNSLLIFVQKKQVAIHELIDSFPFFGSIGRTVYLPTFGWFWWFSRR